VGGSTASRGDQILNAESFERLGYSYVLEEDRLTNETLLEAIEKVYAARETYITAMKSATQADATGVIVKMIKELAK